jgi:hypothetical protein
MAEIVNITPLNPTTFEFQEYSVNDTSLITSVEVENSFDPTTDHIEYFIYDLNGTILTSNVFGYNGYRLLDNVLTIYPEIDLTTQGFTEGQYNTLYNFVSNKLASDPNNNYFISQISPDRTEVRLDTTSIPDFLVISSSIELTNDIANSTGSYYDFYLNFGDNALIIANNVLLDTSSITNPTILIKLYEALPQQFDINSQCWVVTQVASPVAYNVNITQTFDITNDYIYLKGPNTSLNIKNQINNSTDYSNSNQLATTDSIQGSGSLRYQLNSMLADTGIEINVDYSNYDNFIHFSSAQTRLENFYYKLSLIEQYNYSASYSSTTSANYYVSSSNVVWQAKINEIITGFDNYEYFLYFDSGSACWPKTGQTPPYTNYSATSIQGQAFLVSQSLVAEEYDIENNNALINAIPSYLLEDPANAQYELFIEMIGQHFDNVFLYTQDVTNKYNNDNRLNYGVSKDLVADILRDMGIKIYQNNFSTNDLYSALLGLTPSGSLYNLPYTTGSLPTPAGYEYINTYITASSTSSLIPTEDLNAEIYKRIYANLPYLLKKKGTVEGLRALITTYGIPDTILQVNEFGGQDKIIANDYDLWFNQYNYTFDTLGTNYVTSSFQLNSAWGSQIPNAIEVRFQTRGIPSNTGYYSQSIWVTNENTILRLRYTGSAYNSGSYSGSIPNSYNEFALLEFIPDITDLNNSASVYLPFLDGGWWSVIVNRLNAEDYTLVAANKNYQGEDGNYIGFQASSSVNSTSDSWDISSTYYLGYNNSSTLGKIFSGSFQELRFYTTPLSQNAFDDYVMNPYSIDANGVNTAPDTLAFRATLGGELYTSSISVHPKVTGSWITTQSFANTNTFKFNTTPVFVPNTEIFYLNQFPAGIKNRVSNKIRQQAEILPYSGSEETNLPTNQVLSPFISVQQSVSVSGSYTPNIDYVEVAFSPQNEINNDIAGQLGYFNIGEYIGDPRLVSSSAESYPALDAIRDYYFEKYTGNYNIWDYIRLIKYFDNSLFKMIADWTPARTDLASGIVIKQTTLERNKYPVPQPNITSSIAWVESGSYSGSFLLSTSSYVCSSPPLTLNIASNIVSNITGFFNNTSPVDGDIVYITYYPPTYPSDPSVVLFNEFPLPNQIASFNLTNISLSAGSQLIFSNTNISTFTLLTANVTGPNIFTPTNTPYQTENILITGSAIQMYTITGSSGGSIVDTEILTFSTSSYTLFAGDIITFNLSSSGAERISCYISSSAENSNPAIITLYNQSTSSYTTSSAKLNYNLNQTFNISTGYLKIQNNSTDATIKLSNLEVYQAPAYYATIQTLSGSTQQLVTNEFDFNGELSGSIITVTDGNLNNCNPEIVQVYEAFPDILISGYGNWYFRSYDFDFDKTYYLTFTYTSDPTYGSAFVIVDASNSNNLRVIYDSGTIPPSTTITVNKLQVQGIVAPLNFIGQTALGSTTINNLTIFEDYIEPDCLVIAGNVDAPRLNPEFFDVDFSSNSITAVNAVNIISASRGQGQAYPSTTPASNYTTARIANPRYEGCKNTSPDFNVITNQKLPSVEKYTSYFIYTPGGRGNTLAERSGSGNYQIGFLVDELGNTIQPKNNNTSSAYIPNLIDAFGADTPVVLSPNSSSTLKQSEFTVYKPAVISNIIMYSDTGSLGTTYLVSGSYSSINFQIDPNNKANYNFFTGRTGSDQIVASSTSATASYNNVTNDVAQGWTGSIYAYDPPYSSFIRNTISVGLAISASGTGGVTMSIMNGNTPLSSVSYSAPDGNINARTSTLQYFNTSDLYWVKITNNTNANINIKNTIFPLTISYFNIYSSSTGSFQANTPYWYTSSNNSLVLSSSVDIGKAYQAFEQVPIAGSGFDNPQPLTILPYDEIRFEGNEATVATIISSSFDNSNPSAPVLYLHLQAPFDFNSVDIQYFALRRWVPSIDNIIINSPGTIMGSGFIFPKYMSPLLRKNLPSIIENLTNKGLV